MHDMKNLGIVRQSITMSIQNIIGNKMRSFLTTLGIIIGVMAVIALITIVQGVTTEFMSQFSDMGAGMLSVSAYGTPLKRGISENELEEIAQIENVKGVSPNISFNTSAVRNGTVTEDISVMGVNDVLFRTNDILGFGRPLKPTDMAGDVNVCVVDHDFAKNVMPGIDPLGQEFILEGCTYKIVGVEKAEESGGLMADMTQSELKGYVYIPYKNAMKLSGMDLIRNFDVYVEDIEKSNIVQSKLEKYLDRAFNNAEDSYWVMNLDSLLDAMDTMMSMLTGMLAGIASIALLVGGIGIMNMMLVSVTERTKEIGLRKALGATPARIQAQFLIEAVILSLAGGFVGMLLGVGISMIAASALKVQFHLSLSAIYLGVGFSAGVGIIFGWAPARKASRLNPIDALRSE